MKKTLLHILMHNGRLLQRAIGVELAPLGLHHGQGRILQVISGCGEIIQAKLAQRMDIRPATVTNMLKPLEERRLIRRKTDRKTNRAMLVSLTPLGKRTCSEVLAAWERVEARISKCVPAAERDALFYNLEGIRSILGGEGPKELA